MAAVLLPLVALGLAALWAVAVGATRAASAGSVVVALGLPAGAAIAGRPGVEVAAFAGCGALVVLRHRSNLGRLRRGDEPTLAGPDRG